MKTTTLDSPQQKISAPTAKREARYLYKCRRCGRFSNNLCSGEHMALPTLIDAIYNIRRSQGFDVRLVDAHNCADGGLGVADLIGVDFVA